MLWELNASRLWLLFMFTEALLMVISIDPLWNVWNHHTVKCLMEMKSTQEWFYDLIHDIAIVKLNQRYTVI